jgi:phage baseplate assembly protein W
MSGPVVSSARPALPALAVGWPLLPTPDADGALAWPTAAISVKQMIEVILRTAPGEQLMRPEFGAGLERLVHEPNTLATRARAQEQISAALEQWEPRILLDRLDVDASPDPRELLVTIAYRHRLTGEAVQLAVSVPVGGA